MLLLIDTSQREAHVILAKDGMILGQRSWEATPDVPLLTQVDELLQKHDISLSDIQRVAVHRGPGHYSALRAGIVTATMLAHALGVDLVWVEGKDGTELVPEALGAQPTSIVNPRYEFSAPLN